MGPARVKVLIVDTNLATLTETARILQQAGYDTPQAANGVDALREIRAIRPDLVLFDVMLADIPGAEVLRQIRADPDLANTCFVLLTSQQTGQEQPASVLDAGADGSIPRPMANEEFLAHVRSHLRQRELTKQLRWQTAFLEAQVNSSLDGILIIDHDRKMALQNRRFLDLFKIPPHIANEGTDENRLRWVTDKIKNPEQFLEKVRHLYAHPNEISRDEIELRDGTLLDRYSSPVVGKDGENYGRIWKFRDITEQRRVDQELKEAKLAAVLREGAKRYNFLADSVRLIIWTARPDGCLDYYNKSWFDYTGLTLAQTQDWGWEAVVHPDDLQACIGRWTRSFTTGDDYEIEYRFKRAADGAYRWFLGRASARRDENGQIVQWVGTCTDIDDQKRAEDELRRAHNELESRVAQRTAELAKSNEALLESDEQFHQLVDNITDAFWIRSPDLSKVHFISPAFEKIWGRSVNSLYDKPHQWTDFILPEDRERVLAAFAALTGGAPNLDIEYRITRPDGEVRWVRVRGFQVRDATNKLIRHTGIVTDITERKLIEAQLFQSQKLETVGKLAGGIAHEFNSILTTIIGHSELLLLGLPPGSPMAKNVTEIGRSADRAATLTRQLLAYGRKQALRPEILDLDSLLADMESNLRLLLGRGVDIVIARSAGLKAVRIDPGQLQQVIMNIATNASEAMPHGGKLLVETAVVTVEQRSLHSLPELQAGEYVMLTITDTGVGMSEEVKAHIFEPFFTTKDIGQGPGLGLSMCHGIIKQSGGQIGVESEPGRGAAFKLYLPRVEQKAKTAVADGDLLDLPRGAETILLVEDDPTFRELTANWLRRLGYTVVAVNSIEALSAEKPRAIGLIDLFFNNVVMPGLNDKELSERVRELYPNTKILFATTSTTSSTVPQRAPINGVAFLQKPFAPSALAHKLRAVLDPPSPEPSES
jgi:PAS domain S-box-containing protein